MIDYGHHFRESRLTIHSIPRDTNNQFPDIQSRRRMLEVSLISLIHPFFFVFYSKLIRHLEPSRPPLGFNGKYHLTARQSYSSTPKSFTSAPCIDDAK